MRFSLNRLDSVRTLLLFIAAALAVVTTMGAALNVRAAASVDVAATGAVDLNLPLSRIDVTATPYQAHDYQRFADKIRVLYPDITAAPGPHSIVLSGTTPQSYMSWRLALSSTMPLDGDYRWTLKGFCAANCEGAYFRSEVAITKQEIKARPGA